MWRDFISLRGSLRVKIKEDIDSVLTKRVMNIIFVSTYTILNNQTLNIIILFRHF